MSSRFDIIVAGQSIAAYVTAIGFAAEGRQVAFVSDQPFPRPDALLPTCFLLQRTVRLFDRLGLGAELAAQGGQQKSLRLVTPAGSISPPDDSSSGSLHIRRYKLHNLLQNKLRTYKNVTYFSDNQIIGVNEDSGRVTGLFVRTPGGDNLSLTASLVVAADGYCSQLAAFAAVPEQRHQNGRFGYYAYFQVERSDWPRPVMWLNNPDVAFVLPDEQGFALALAMPTRDKQLYFSREPQQAFLDYFANLTNGPELTRGTLQSNIRPVPQNDIVSRPVVYKQMALTGSAALANDPIWCLNDSWAADSAFLLLSHLTGTGNDPASLTASLKCYNKAQKQTFRLPQRWLANYASGRKFNRREQWLLNAAVSDPQTGLTVHNILYGETRAEVITRALSVWRIGSANAQQVARRTGRLLEQYTLQEG